MIVLPDSIGMLLIEASRVLQVDAQTVMTSGNCIVGSIDVIRDNDYLYISEGDGESVTCHEASQAIGTIGNSASMLHTELETAVQPYNLASWKRGNCKHCKP